MMNGNRHSFVRIRTKYPFEWFVRLWANEGDESNDSDSKATFLHHIIVIVVSSRCLRLNLPLPSVIGQLFMIISIQKIRMTRVK